MNYEVPTATYNDVGPYQDLYDHGPVTIITGEFANPDEGTLFVCLDCGYTAHDPRLFMGEECDPEQNGVNETWRDVDFVGNEDS